MLYWKRRDAKVPLDEVAASDNSSDSTGGSGGGVSIEIDQSYNSGSTNAQSGTAVAQAVSQLETQITTKYGDTLTYKGTKTNYTDLPSNGQNQKGDVWNVSADGANYVWDGTQWDKLSENLEGFAKKNEYDSLNSSFTAHKANQDSNLKHLTEEELEKVKEIDILTEDSIKQTITQTLTEKMSTGNIVTNTTLESKLSELQTQVQNTVTQNITQTLSSDYVNTADWEKYQKEHTEELNGFLKCDQADELKVFTSGQQAPALSDREERIIYLVGEGATVAEAKNSVASTSQDSVVSSD